MTSPGAPTEWELAHREVASAVACGAACCVCGRELNTKPTGTPGGPPFGRQVPGTTTASGTRRVCPTCDARPDGPPFRTDMLDYPTAWAIQARADLEHDDECSSSVERGAFLCDCGALTRAWAAMGGQP